MSTLLEAVEMMRAERAGLVVRLSKIDAAIEACCELLGEPAAHAPALENNNHNNNRQPEPQAVAQPRPTAAHVVERAELLLSILRSKGELRPSELFQWADLPTDQGKEAANYLLSAGRIYATGHTSGRRYHLVESRVRRRLERCQRTRRHSNGEGWEQSRDSRHALQGADLMALIALDHRTAGADDREIKLALELRSLDGHTHGELTRLDEMGKRTIKAVLMQAAETIAKVVRAQQQQANPDRRKQA